MSRYSLDSLDNCSSLDDESITNLTKSCRVTLKGNDLEDTGNYDAGCNESPEVGATIQPESPIKSRGNALIASTVNVVGNTCPSGEEKRPITLGATSNFRLERPAPKKLNVARRSLSLTPEFRRRVCGKSPRNEGIESFMKAGKKLGKAHRTIVDNEKKKLVSYLELHRKKFGGESSQCILNPKGSTLLVRGDRTDQRSVDVDEGSSIEVPRDDESEVGFYRRVMELGSQEARESCSCEALDRSDPDESVSKSSYDLSKCFSESGKSNELRRRVVYQPYSVEDYKCLSVPQADRSLGPDRIEMESKAEWLMRRRSYGDSVSSRNRQRILRYTQKLKESRRADVEKPPLVPLTNVKNPAPVSKTENDKPEESESLGLAKSFSNVARKAKNKKASRIGKLPALIVEAKTNLSETEPGEDSSRFLDFYETSSDTNEDSRNLRNLRLRHLAEKKTIDQLFKRGLRAS